MQGQFSLFPTEQEQIQAIREAARVPPPPPAAAPGSAEIDNALLRWNGREESRRAVAEYMAAHGRERETAAWLAREYGVEDAGEPLRLDIPGVEDAALLTWPQVQRRIARLIRVNLLK